MIIVTMPFNADAQPTFQPAKIQEEELVAGLRSGCEHKFMLLYSMYAPALKGIIARIVKSDEVAEDILQETFLKIWNSIGQYQPAKGRLFTWMATLARNTSIDQLRSKAQVNSDKSHSMDDVSIEVDMENQVQFNTETIGVKQLTTKLKHTEKEILDLIYFQGYTHTEAAEQLEIPVGTVKTRLRKAIGNLRMYF